MKLTKMKSQQQSSAKERLYIVICIFFFLHEL